MVDASGRDKIDGRSWRRPPAVQLKTPNVYIKSILRVYQLASAGDRRVRRPVAGKRHPFRLRRTRTGLGQYNFPQAGHLVWARGKYDRSPILSFAKNASADMSLRGNAFITVMQTAELRDLDDPADTRDLPRNWTLLVEAQMGPRSVVVSEIRSQGCLEMPGVQDHEVVQTVSSYRADQAFGIRILPGTPWRCEYFFNVQ